jgi:hypothetical protein
MRPWPSAVQGPYRAALTCDGRQSVTPALGSLSPWAQDGHRPDLGPLVLCFAAMLARIARTLSPAPAAPLAQAATYRGVSRGWEPIGAPRPWAQAQALAALAARVRPDYITRARRLSP